MVTTQTWEFTTIGCLYENKIHLVYFNKTPPCAGFCLFIQNLPYVHSCVILPMDDLLLNKITESEELEFYTAETTSDLKIPLIESQVSAGFPSPADDYMDLPIDLNEFLIKHPSATFYVRVKGDSMEGAGIRNGDLLIVDRAEEPRNKSIVLGIINGEFTVKRIMKKSGDLFLIPDNPDYKPIKIDDNMEFQVWGVVTYVVHKPE